MSYLVLARKYRPKTFAEVAGQDVVTRTLRGAIAEGRVGHAYLFFGPRGTGKTTSARLFAKALNCERGPTDEPCGTCERCLSYDAGTEPDLIEIDAASNTGVDNVRSLRDQAAYVPLKARFKVFLIDEVHMLSKAAFNALLKTLEEPPPHVKFLFATTELHKVPGTVSSRCQVLRLSPLSEDQIVARLDEVFKLENIEAEDGVTAELARRARGGMRDALSLADQLLALVGRTPTVEDTARLAGESSTDAIESVLDAIQASDKPALLAALPGREGDEPAFLDAILDYLRASLLVALLGENAPMLAESANPAARARMKERASALGAARLELVLADLLHARERMGPLHMRAHARLILESTLLDLCRAEATMPIEEVIARLEALESGAAPPSRPSAGQAKSGPSSPAPRSAAKSAYVPPVARRESKAASAPKGASQEEPAAPEPPLADPELATKEIEPTPPPPRAAAPPRVQTNSTHDRWNGFLDELSTTSAPLAKVIERRGQLVRDSGGSAPLKLRGLSEDERGLVDSAESRRAVEDAFRAANGEAIQIKLEIHEPAEGGNTDAFTERVRDLFNGRIEG